MTAPRSSWVPRPSVPRSRERHPLVAVVDRDPELVARAIHSLAEAGMVGIGFTSPELACVVLARSPALVIVGSASVAIDVWRAAGGADRQIGLVLVEEPDAPDRAAVESGESPGPALVRAVSRPTNARELVSVIRALLGAHPRLAETLPEVGRATA